MIGAAGLALGSRGRRLLRKCLAQSQESYSVNQVVAAGVAEEWDRHHSRTAGNGVCPIFPTEAPLIL